MDTEVTTADTPDVVQGSQSQTTQNTGQSDGAQTSEPAKTAMTSDTPADAADGAQDANKDNADPQKNAEGQDKKEGQDSTPENYEPFKLPENVEVDQASLEEFTAFAKESKLSQEQAQKFVDMGMQRIQSAVNTAYTAWVDAYAQKVNTWTESRKADKEIGGTEEAQTLALSGAARAARAIGGDALMKALDETGAGNHPEVIRAFYRIRDMVGQDGKLIINNQGGGEPKSPAQTLYPNLPTNN